MRFEGLIDGDLVRFKYMGEWEYAKIVGQPQVGYSPIDWSLIEPGMTVRQCVWKGDTLVIRRVFKMPNSPGRTERLAWVREQQEAWDAQIMNSVPVASRIK